MREQKYKDVSSKIGHAARLAAAIFAFQEWGYGANEHVPGREELADTIKYLLALVANRDSGKAGTGRFIVEWNEDFNCYEIMLIVGDLSSRELYEETGIDIMAKANLTEES